MICCYCTIDCIHWCGVRVRSVNLVKTVLCVVCCQEQSVLIPVNYHPNSVRHYNWRTTVGSCQSSGTYRNFAATQSRLLPISNAYSCSSPLTMLLRISRSQSSSTPSEVLRTLSCSIWCHLTSPKVSRSTFCLKFLRSITTPPF